MNHLPAELYHQILDDLQVGRLPTDVAADLLALSLTSHHHNWLTAPFLESMLQNVLVDVKDCLFWEDGADLIRPVSNRDGYRVINGLKQYINSLMALPKQFRPWALRRTLPAQPVHIPCCDYLGQRFLGNGSAQIAQRMITSSRVDESSVWIDSYSLRQVKVGFFEIPAVSLCTMLKTLHEDVELSFGESEKWVKVSMGEIRMGHHPQKHRLEEGSDEADRHTPGCTRS